MIFEPLGEPSPQSLEQTTVLPAAPLPTTDELPAVAVAPRPPNGHAPRSSQPLLRAITAGAVVGIALIGVLLLVTSLDDDDAATAITTQQTEAATTTADDQPVDDDDSVPSDGSSSITEGAPGHWQVAGVPDRLNVRAGPGTDNPVIGSVGNGDRNIGGTGKTADVNGSEWIEIELSADETGWVSGRFLRADIPPDGSVPADAADSQSNAEAGGSRVCFSSSGDPQRVARVDFSDHTNIGGVLVTFFAAAPITEQISGTLVDGQAAMTLTDAATGDSRREKWNFTPASIRSGSQSPLAVVDCGSIEELLG